MTKQATRAVQALDKMIAEWREIDTADLSKLTTNQVEAARMTIEEMIVRAQDATEALRNGKARFVLARIEELRKP